MNEERLSNLEESFQPESDDVVVVDIRVTYSQTYFEGGMRRERDVPGVYDPTHPSTVEWPPAWHAGRKRWERLRFLYPINLDSAGEPLADHGVLRDPEVTGD
jgi:hypothetical protein